MSGLGAAFRAKGPGQTGEALRRACEGSAGIAANRNLRQLPKKR